PYTIDVYRIGWYGGLGGRLMKHLGPFLGKQQPGGTSSGGVTSPGCPYDSSTGMIACQWAGDGLGNGSYTLDTSVPPDGSNTADWTSGIYLALLTTNQVQYPTGCGPSGTLPCDPDHQSYIIFVIREDGRASQVIYQQPVATYEAYNNYPDDGQTGKSLYDSGSYGPLTGIGTQRAVKVSFDRPYTYTDHTGAGDFLHWEIYFIRWLERNGYDVTYSTDVDTHVAGASLLQHKAVLSIGHAEYWSHEMRQAFETARDGGVSLAFFGANAVYSQVRFEPSPVTNVPNRVLTAYKDASLDPVNNPAYIGYNPSLTTVPFRSSPLNNPEQSLLGIMYADYFNADNPALSYVVQNSNNWVYAGTGLTNNSGIPGVLGYELDQYFSNAPSPIADPTTYVLLSDSPFAGANGANYGNSSILEATSGAWVFDAGTIDWSWGLDSYVPPAGINTRGMAAPSAAIQQVTANILNRFVISRPLGPTHLSGNGVTNNGGRYKINLMWTDNSNNETGFQVERSADDINFFIIGTTKTNTTSFVDGTVSPATVYYYRVTAFNTGGNSPYSNVFQAGNAPTAPSQLAANAISNSEIDLSWIDTSTNETAITVERSTDGVTFSQIASLPAGSTSYQNTGITSGGTYYYRVRAQNSFGASPYSNIASATVVGPPAAPSNMQAVAISASQVNLTWTDNSTNEDGFTVQRSTDASTYATIVTTGPNVTSFSDTGLTRSTKYYYRVQSFNTYGSSSFTSTSVATPRK
ncbi:MAG TPA: fibronectin type III domain-containing protein, partial [Ktedonobacteraceae bacterium]|nr:fibronectin type III domain-containing protein [Ktedonobacteraceae bacterium]